MPSTSSSRILSINVGSSTIKFGVYDMPDGAPIFESQVDRVDSIAAALDGIHGELERAGVGRIRSEERRVGKECRL